MANIWCNPLNLAVQELEPYVYKILMDKPEGKKRILKGNPWIFRNYWLILKEWDDIKPLNFEDFNRASIWVHIWGIPINGETPIMGSKFGARLGEVVEADSYEREDKSSIIKVKVNIRVDKHIKLGMYIGSIASEVN